MGLLDDAIREHLELKRLRGADPGVVAREEQDALGPVLREGPSDRGEGGDEASPDAYRLTSLDAGSSGDEPSTAQETVEINMEAELAAGTDPGHEQEAAPPKPAGPPAHHAHTPVSIEESLEWEVPDHRLDETVAGAGSDDDSGTGEDDYVEDVLEETPDFLRETPEQERLWFEQRPPRDFDFNE
jgi:hypothetical protein